MELCPAHYQDERVEGDGQNMGQLCDWQGDKNTGTIHHALLVQLVRFVGNDVGTE